MPRQPIPSLKAGRIFLALLACAYLIYLGVLGNLFLPSIFAPAAAVADHPVDTQSTTAISYWTVANMISATDDDQEAAASSSLALKNTITDISTGKPASQKGQASRNESASYPLSTVGKVFFSNSLGQNMMCSGTAVVSANSSVVDTAGHCIYNRNEWMQNLIFCPLYDNGNTPYGCWAARDLEAPTDWINARPNDYHHDFGIAIVAANSRGLLTNVVGGVGWAYNQTVDKPFSAYGYPARAPYDGQTRVSCENATGKIWQHGDGNAIAIPCDMTGGSSGGPWFVKIGNNWYLNGHNDFGYSLQPGYMFSPYYDDTWFAMYDKAQHA